MRTHYLLFILVFFFSLSNSFAQIDKEINNYSDTTEDIVVKGRKLLLDQLFNNDWEKSQEIYNYLNEITVGTNYTAFYYTEDLFLRILFRDWDLVLKFMADLEVTPEGYLYPECDPLTPQLFGLVAKWAETLKDQVQAASITEEQKQIIDLTLYIIENEEPDSYYTQQYKAFEKQHKDSEYEYFLKNFLPRKYIHGSIAFALGSGMVIPTDKFRDNFTPNAVFHLGMDINVNRLFSSLSISISNLKLQEPFSASSSSDDFDFEKNEGFSYFHAGANAGYFLVRNERVQLAPYGTIGVTTLQSTRFDEDDDGEDYELCNSFTYGAGLHFSVKLAEFQKQNIYGGTSISHLAFKVNGGYNIISNFKKSSFNGNAAYWHAGLVWSFGEF